MKMNRRPAIDGKVAIITGASSGIGEATTREFASAGAITVLAARREERLKRLQKEIEEMSGKALAVPTDLTKLDQITNLVQTTLSTFGLIDILANIAGWAVYDWFEELSPEEMRGPFDVNVLGMAELIRQVVPTMKTQRSGFILNMSSYVSRLAVIQVRSVEQNSRRATNAEALYITCLSHLDGSVVNEWRAIL